MTVMFGFWFFIRIALVQAFVIPTPSMAPVLSPGDAVLVDKSIYGSKLGPYRIDWPWSHSPRRFDIVAFQAPKDPGIDYVKRLIGLPGDTVAVHQGVLYINGKYIKESYANHTPPDSDIARLMALRLREQKSYLAQPRPYDPSWLEWGPIIVPPGHYFMLGDNRPQSEDSRFWGFVPQNNVVGSPSLIYLSTTLASPIRLHLKRMGTRPR